MSRSSRRGFPTVRRCRRRPRRGGVARSGAADPGVVRAAGGPRRRSSARRRRGRPARWRPRWRPGVHTVPAAASCQRLSPQQDPRVWPSEPAASNLTTSTTPATGHRPPATGQGCRTILDRAESRPMIKRSTLPRCAGRRCRRLPRPPLTQHSLDRQPVHEARQIRCDPPAPPGARRSGSTPHEPGFGPAYRARRARRRPTRSVCSCWKGRAGRSDMMPATGVGICVPVVTPRAATAAAWSSSGRASGGCWTPR